MPNTDNRNWPYPNKGKKPYYTEIVSTFDAQDADVQSLWNKVLSSITYRKAVIDYVDNTASPPTEVTGDRYILDFTGVSNADWDGADGGDIVEFNGASWEASSPDEGDRAYVDSENQDRQYVDDGTPDWEARNASVSTLKQAYDAQSGDVVLDGDYLEWVLNTAGFRIHSNDGSGGKGSDSWQFEAGSTDKLNVNAYLDIFQMDSESFDVDCSGNAGIDGNNSLTLGSSGYSVRINSTGIRSYAWNNRVYTDAGSPDDNAIALTASAGGIALSAATSLVVDTGTYIDINAEGTISLGSDPVDQNIYVGRQGDRSIEFGSNSGATAIVLDAGSGGVDVDVNNTGGITMNTSGPSAGDILIRTNTGGSGSIDLVTASAVGHMSLTTGSNGNINITAGSNINFTDGTSGPHTLQDLLSGGGGGIFVLSTGANSALRDDATTTVAGGDYAFAMGEDCSAGGDYSFAFGGGVSVLAQSAFGFGTSNSIDVDSEYTAAFGSDNTFVNSSFCLLQGEYNEFTNSYGNFIGGAYNTIEDSTGNLSATGGSTFDNADSNLVGGTVQSLSNSNDNIVGGYSHDLEYSLRNLVSGDNHTLYEVECNIVGGDTNLVDDYAAYNIVCGIDNTATDGAFCTILSGESNYVGADSACNLVVGDNNSIDSESTGVLVHGSKVSLSNDCNGAQISSGGHPADGNSLGQANNWDMIPYLGNTTNSTPKDLSMMDGNSGVFVLEDGHAYLFVSHVIAKCVSGTSDEGTKSWKIETHVNVTDAGVASIIGTRVKTVYGTTSVGNESSWDMEPSVNTVGSNTFVLQATGATGDVIYWNSSTQCTEVGVTVS